MLYTTKKIFFLANVVLGMLVISMAARAGSNKATNLGFQVCVKKVAGVAYKVIHGIDAAEGEIKGKNGTVKFMISRHPNLPSEMNLKPDYHSIISRNLTSNLTFIRESKSRNGLGREKLYGYSMKIVQGPNGSIQDQIFVELWTDGGLQSYNLLTHVGKAMFRCRGKAH